jgi:hypothetical protein
MIVDLVKLSVYIPSDSSIQEIENFVEVLTGIGPLGYNHDVVSRFTTLLNSNQTIYTDDNCFESHLRVYDDTK